MNQQQILQIALEQSAIDLSCTVEDLTCGKPRVVVSKNDPRARKYLKLPHVCQIASYGQNVVASVREDLLDDVSRYVNTHKAHRCFETPQLLELNEILRPLGHETAWMDERFLPQLDQVQVISSWLPLRVLGQKDFRDLYLPQWSNALSDSRPELDVIGVGAYDGERLVGLAGASADCDTMYQIGIDVLPEYRHQGLAKALTSHLTQEILALGKVPFYTAAWSNIASVRNAIACGYRPCWVEVGTMPIHSR